MSTTPVWDGWNIWLTFALSPAALIAQSSYWRIKLMKLT